MALKESETFIITALESINAMITETINTPVNAEHEHLLTIKDAPNLVSRLFKMSDAFMAFVANELQMLFSEETSDERLKMEHTQGVLSAYRERIERMASLYLEVLDVQIQEPFEKAQFYILSMSNHLLASVYDFNDQLLDVFNQNSYGASLELAIDLKKEMSKFNTWFDEVKEQTSHDLQHREFELRPESR